MSQGVYREIVLSGKRIVPALEQLLSRLAAQNSTARWFVDALEIRTRPLRLTCVRRVPSTPYGEVVEELTYVLDDIRAPLVLEGRPSDRARAVLCIGETIALALELRSSVVREVVPPPPPPPVPPLVSPGSRSRRDTLVWEQPAFSPTQRLAAPTTPRPDDHSLGKLFEQAMESKGVLL